MIKKFFTKEEIQKINTAITEAEKITNGEIVPIIVAQSSSYAWVHFILAIFGIFFSSVILGIFSYQANWPFSMTDIFFYQLAGFAIALLLSLIPFVKRVFLPRSMKVLRVHEAAMANFISAGVTETVDRTGVLIYISLLEHRVEILADRGINQKVPENYWQQEVATLVNGIKENQASDALVQVIQHIGKKLEEFFPKTLDNKNEIPDNIVGKSF